MQFMSMYSTVVKSIHIFFVNWMTDLYKSLNGQTLKLIVLGYVMRFSLYPRNCYRFVHLKHNPVSSSLLLFPLYCNGSSLFNLQSRHSFRVSRSQIVNTNWYSLHNYADYIFWTLFWMSCLDIKSLYTPLLNFSYEWIA